MQTAYLNIENRIGYITIDRPQKRNALNPELIRDLKDCINIAEQSNDVKLIVLKATGETFCAGADLEYIKQLQNNTFEDNFGDSQHLAELIKMIYTSSKVIIAQVEGHALAGGCGIAVASDFVFSTQDAKFGFTESKIGFVPAIVSVILLRKIPEGKAKELLYTGRIITASEAREYGIVNYLSDKDNIAKEVKTFAEKLCVEASASSLALIKQMIPVFQDMNLNQALTYACELNAKARTLPDCKRGIESFLNRQTISW
ncbi:MAG: enoyl-CoA hydratase/isomerase family protein [Cytophagaceae bacterium]|nr:enoyl-CoA hydratase/isomerase family protein [Cytophagaceae bacterium]MDW8456772.1 enoyl-CoA hydratase/isomerase family protein [Cytophagaceae bacterium]